MMRMKLVNGIEGCRRETFDVADVIDVELFV
jgi:hypothetical protein